MIKPHKHAEFIKAYADGATIQFRISPSDNWEDAQADDDTAPAFSKNYEYRIKPDPPKYPQTRLSENEMRRLAESTPGSFGECYTAIANAAIARAIDDGDVVPATMLEKLAEAIAEDCDLRMRSSTYAPLNLAAIINRVKEDK